jgi:hypothetical protein
MYGAYEPGTSVRTLAADDVAGICSVYGPDFTRATAAGIVPGAFCDPTPHHGLDTGAKGTIRHGCNVGSGSTDGRATIGLVLLSAGLLSRKRRARGRKTGP